MHIKWSVRDDVGFIELWHDGVPQTFGEPCARQTRCTVRTLMPGGDAVYFNQGCIRIIGFVRFRRFDSPRQGETVLAVSQASLAFATKQSCRQTLDGPVCSPRVRTGELRRLPSDTAGGV